MFRLSRTKKEDIKCIFSSRRQKNKKLVTISGEKFSQTCQVYYLRSIIHNNGEIKKNVTNKIKAG